MSIKMMSQVWEYSSAEGSELLLLLAIADFADDDGFAFPGTSTLAKKIRMSERSVKRLRQKLYEKGELQYLKGGKGKGDRLSVRVTPVSTKGDKPGKERVTPVSPEPPIEPSINTTNGVGGVQENCSDDVPYTLSEVYRFYESNFTMLTPFLSDAIAHAYDDFPSDWIVEAMQIALTNSRRKWSYVEGILKRWHADGKQDTRKQEVAQPKMQAVLLEDA